METQWEESLVASVSHSHPLLRLGLQAPIPRLHEQILLWVWISYFGKVALARSQNSKGLHMIHE